MTNLWGSHLVHRIDTQQPCSRRLYFQTNTHFMPLWHFQSIRNRLAKNRFSQGVHSFWTFWRSREGPSPTSRNRSTATWTRSSARTSPGLAIPFQNKTPLRLSIGACWNWFQKHLIQNSRHNNFIGWAISFLFYHEQTQLLLFTVSFLWMSPYCSKLW